MSIQISVVVWTLICFAALYLVLRNLLFKPMLSVMDQRKKKIEDAAAAKKETERLLEMKRLEALAEQEALSRKAAEEEKLEAEKVRLEGKRLLEDAKRERITIVDDYRARTESDYDTDMAKAADQIDGIADRFLKRLFDN